MDKAKGTLAGMLTASRLYLSKSKVSNSKVLPIKEHIELNKPIVIVGSGYGAAVAALRLCEAGKKVLMLEMGVNWKESGIPYSGLLRPGRSAAWLKRKTIAPFMNIFPLKPFTGALDNLILKI